MLTFTNYLTEAKTIPTNLQPAKVAFGIDEENDGKFVANNEHAITWYKFMASEIKDLMKSDASFANAHYSELKKIAKMFEDEADGLKMA